MAKEEQEVTEIKDTIVSMVVCNHKVYVATRHSLYVENFGGANFRKLPFIATAEEETKEA